MVLTDDAKTLFCSIALPGVIPANVCNLPYTCHKDIVKEAWKWYFLLRNRMADNLDRIVAQIPFKTIKWQHQMNANLANNKAMQLKAQGRH